MYKIGSIDFPTSPWSLFKVNTYNDNQLNGGTVCGSCCGSRLLGLDGPQSASNANGINLKVSNTETKTQLSDLHTNQEYHVVQCGDEYLHMALRIPK